MIDYFQDTKNLPFCKGCGHHLITRNTQKALEKMNISPRDVIMVTDIGCHGIIDKNSLTHTVHGLHGRSIALGAGITAGLNNPDKKIIVFIGDGGITIGLSHLIGAAARNFDMTVIVHNNMLYGMTGGQPSDLTPPEFKLRTQMPRVAESNLDICTMAKDSGAAHVSRINAFGDFSDKLYEAFTCKGFSLVEIVELCTAYGVKENPGISAKEISTRFQLEPYHFTKSGRSLFKLNEKGGSSLLDSLEVIETSSEHSLTGEMGIIIAGSAGEGVQTAAEMLAIAALGSGLHVTKKGNYPVTVGTGFSAVELNISQQPIQFTGMKKVNWALITSEDGLKYQYQQLESMKSGNILLDQDLEPPTSGAVIKLHPFRKSAGAKNAVLLAVIKFIRESGIIPVETFKAAITKHKAGQNMDREKLEALFLADETYN